MIFPAIVSARTAGWPEKLPTLIPTELPLITFASAGVVPPILTPVMTLLLEVVWTLMPLVCG